MEQTNPHMVKRLSISLKGRVQGVGYRYFIKEAAQRYHISGWVKNAEGGLVLLEAQGEDEMLKRFLQDVEQGPRTAHIEEMNVEEINTTDQERSFSIRISDQSNKWKSNLPS